MLRSPGIPKRGGLHRGVEGGRRERYSDGRDRRRHQSDCVGQRFRGIVLRFRAGRLMAAGGRVYAEAGAVLQDLVDFTIARGLKGLETLSGIPGSVGAAVYGNAG